MRIVLLSVLVLMVFSSLSSAQMESRHDSLTTLRRISPQDSIGFVQAAAGIQASTVDSAASYTSSKSPGLALLFSAVLPGAGQFYNESYWKIPILVGFGYYFATRWIDNNDSTKHYRELYAQSISAQLPGGDGNFQRLREFYKGQRDTFSWYFFIYYIVNLVDAYVDASLYDFNVGDDLSIHVQPTFEQRPVQRAGVSLRIHF
jgi:hypothetical protein